MAGGRCEGVVTTMVRRCAQRIDDVAHREKAEQPLMQEDLPALPWHAPPRGQGRVIVAGPAAVDAARLIQVLCRIMDLGNTVLVIEHDLAQPAGLAHRGVFGRTAPVGGVRSRPARVIERAGTVTAVLATVSHRAEPSDRNPRRNLSR